MNNLADIAAALKGTESVLICGHVMPDGDSLGSVLALGLILEGMGKKVTMAGADRLRKFMIFCRGWPDTRLVCPRMWNSIHWLLWTAPYRKDWVRGFRSY